MDEKQFRQEVRDLKARIHQDPAVRAQYDLNDDGRISPEEWDQAVSGLRQQLERQSRVPQARPVVEGIPEEPLVDAGAPSLINCREIIVRQAVEHVEAFTGIETTNRYVFIDSATGTDLGGCEEDAGDVGTFFIRQVLGSARPLNLSITDASRGIWMEGKRPFSFIGFIKPPMMSVSWNQGLLGTVQRVWPLIIKRRYELRLANQPGPCLTIQGNLLRPWSFPVKRAGRQVGTILKKWSGVGKEIFTDADNFMIQVQDDSLSEDERRLLVAAALAIDFDFFEKGGND